MSTFGINSTGNINPNKSAEIVSPPSDGVSSLCCSPKANHLIATSWDNQEDICQLGMDQRKVNVLAREYCDDIKRKNKPIILSHHMLPGLGQGQEKMSKSDPSSAVFMEDEEDEVNKKIKKAYCPPRIVEGNPCLEYIKYIVFPWFNEFKVERKEQHGGAKVFATYEELVADYAKGDLHPGDLKPALSKALNKILQPVRDHFKNDKKAKALLKKVKVWLSQGDEGTK